MPRPSAVIMSPSSRARSTFESFPTARPLRTRCAPACCSKAVRFEAAKYLPSVQESAVEYSVLGKSGEPLQLDVLLVAAPNEMVNSRVEAMERAGLEPVAVDIEAFALLRSLTAAGFDLSEPMAVLNMGASFTDFHILFDEKIALTRRELFLFETGLPTRVYISQATFEWNF